MSDRIFLTGGTGFLGTEIISKLIRTTEDDIYVLVRAKTEEAAAHRLRACWQHSDELCRAIGGRIFPVTGDFTKPDLGMSEETCAMLRDRITMVFHCGAEIGFQKDEKELMTVNCKGTEQVLTFASSLPRLIRFVHISTAYVAGQKTGLIMEDEPAGTSFSSLYEKSKALAEDLVRASGLPWCICRPGMIVGDSRTGRVKNFNTIYYVLKLVLLGKLPVLPVRPDTGLNLVPVDYVADAAVKISKSEDAAGRTFHLTCPASRQPKAGELMKYIRFWAKRMLSVDLPAPVFMPLGLLKKAGLTYNKKTEGRKKTSLSNMLTLLPYFFSRQEFDRTNTDAVAGSYDLDWRLYIDALLDYACRKNFMRQDGNTVFEQAQVRRSSSRYPICYYDVSSEGIVPCSGQEANRRILRIAETLLAHGIRKGDRVALAGINSVDYMTLDQAIGLIGAVSVPIYYTTPARELALLVSRSGARWFFAGDTRIMDQLGELPPEVKVVSFSEALKVSRSGVIPWEDFLSEGAEATSNEEAPISIEGPRPDDLATIRFTSGTTGEPKGVMFSFAQLAWMGGVMTELLDWNERNRSMRYLSFLPQSHVVEGILASYAPYYMLAKADYYYLNDFSALTDALPRVRPTVFFSVPRFYEKLWDQIMATDSGRRWTAMKEGPSKKALAAVIRRLALKKAGLDSCKQLIVGSAPVSETLLCNFRALGIEIHNAYGQTEAPLITINRLGDNEIPTVGTPLPETTVTAADDGELLVRGPQVTCGYYGLDSDTVRDGILRTGDLGTIHRNGHITLGGRKKEIIVTAYGKNISIPRIEERLKNIPGVSEAVLIGENRPYCTALLWLEPETGSGELPAHEDIRAHKGFQAHEDIRAHIDRMNEGLSHPEQVRKFRIIDRPLSIGDGELTPNLKVKRAAVAAHLREEIEEMYRS